MYISKIYFKLYLLLDYIQININIKCLWDFAKYQTLYILSIYSYYSIKYILYIINTTIT